MRSGILVFQLSLSTCLSQFFLDLPVLAAEPASVLIAQGQSNVPFAERLANATDEQLKDKIVSLMRQTDNAGALSSAQLANALQQLRAIYQELGKPARLRSQLLSQFQARTRVANRFRKLKALQPQPDSEKKPPPPSPPPPPPPPPEPRKMDSQAQWYYKGCTGSKISFTRVSSEEYKFVIDTGLYTGRAYWDQDENGKPVQPLRLVWKDANGANWTGAFTFDPSGTMVGTVETVGNGPYAPAASCVSSISSDPPASSETSTSGFMNVETNGKVLFELDGPPSVILGDHSGAQTPLGAHPNKGGILNKGGSFICRGMETNKFGEPTKVDGLQRVVSFAEPPNKIKENEVVSLVTSLSEAPGPKASAGWMAEGFYPEGKLAEVSVDARVYSGLARVKPSAAASKAELTLGCYCHGSTSWIRWKYKRAGEPSQSVPPAPVPTRRIQPLKPSAAVDNDVSRNSLNAPPVPKLQSPLGTPSRYRNNPPPPPPRSEIRSFATVPPPPPPPPPAASGDRFAGNWVMDMQTESMTMVDASGRTTPIPLSASVGGVSRAPGTSRFVQQGNQLTWQDNSGTARTPFVGSINGDRFVMTSKSATSTFRFDLTYKSAGLMEGTSTTRQGGGSDGSYVLIIQKIWLRRQ